MSSPLPTLFNPPLKITTPPSGCCLFILAQHSAQSPPRFWLASLTFRAGGPHSAAGFSSSQTDEQILIDCHSSRSAQYLPRVVCSAPPCSPCSPCAPVTAREVCCDFKQLWGEQFDQVSQRTHREHLTSPSSLKKFRNSDSLTESFCTNTSSLHFMDLCPKLMTATATTTQ